MGKTEHPREGNTVRGKKRSRDLLDYAGLIAVVAAVLYLSIDAFNRLNLRSDADHTWDRAVGEYMDPALISAVPDESVDVVLVVFSPNCSYCKSSLAEWIEIFNNQRSRSSAHLLFSVVGDSLAGRELLGALLDLENSHYDTNGLDLLRVMKANRVPIYARVASDRCISSISTDLKSLRRMYDLD